MINSGVTLNWEKRLFTKNTRLCEIVKLCIRFDVCPVSQHIEDCYKLLTKIRQTAAVF